MAEKGLNSGKKGGRIEEQALELVRPLIENAGCKLWDVCFEKEGAMWYLRVLFDKEGGLDIDQCEELTGPINQLMDKQDFIKHVDILEAGSPGLSRKLRKPEHFRSMLGEKVRVTIRDEKGKETYVYGTLAGYDEEKREIEVNDEGTVRTLYLPDCVKVNAEL